MKYDFEKFACISKIFNHLGLEIWRYLPQFHAITGCDTTSHFYGVGKVRTLKIVLRSPESLLLIQNLGKEEVLSDEDITSCMLFIQNMMYSGSKTESYVDMRILLYRAQRQKSSSTLPPDPDSFKQAILRAHYQCFVWLRCLSPNSETPPLTSNGWKILEGSVARHIWFVGQQFLPSMTARIIHENKEEAKRMIKK